jgi:hypothetical protein
MQKSIHATIFVHMSHDEIRPCDQSLQLVASCDRTLRDYLTQYGLFTFRELKIVIWGSLYTREIHPF